MNQNTKIINHLKHVLKDLRSDNLSNRNRATKYLKDISSPGHSLLEELTYKKRPLTNRERLEANRLIKLIESEINDNTNDVKINNNEINKMVNGLIGKLFENDDEDDQARMLQSKYFYETLKERGLLTKDHIRRYEEALKISKLQNNNNENETNLERAIRLSMVNQGGSNFIKIPGYGKRKIRYQKNGRAYLIVNKKKLKLN